MRMPGDTLVVRRPSGGSILLVASAHTSLASVLTVQRLLERAKRRGEPVPAVALELDSARAHMLLPEHFAQQPEPSVFPGLGAIMTAVFMVLLSEPLFALEGA